MYLQIWNMSTKASLQQIRGHNGGIWALQYRGNLLVSGSRDKTLRVWQLDTGVCRYTLSVCETRFFFFFR